MKGIVELTSDLVRRVSVTPDDAGCQALIGERLQRAGFSVEHLRYGAVDNLWATHGTGKPVLAFLQGAGGPPFAHSISARITTTEGGGWPTLFRS